MRYIYVLLAVVTGLTATLFAWAYIEIFLGVITPIEIPIVLEGTFEYFEIKWQLIGQDVFSIFIIVINIILFSLFVSLYHRSQKRKKDTFDKDAIKGPFVLYLRSFLDDKITNKRISFINDVRSEEELLVEVMSDIAPVYAIGDPKDKKMPVGASRIYVDDEHWKSTVVDMMYKAVVVVLRLGKTDSFWWEVETAIKNIPLEKIMFVIPESNTFSNVSILYKILLEYKVDIQSLNISIERKSQGSISSFLYFDQEGKPISTEVKIPRFTRIILSYEKILRNALSGFRAKFGLTASHKNTFRWAIISQILLILYIVFIGASKFFSDIVSLKYQMPYELVEKCVANTNFVNKYSDEINATNLTWGLVESRKGLFTLEDDKYKRLIIIEARAVELMNKDEFEQLQVAPKNLLLMIKKYVPDNYEIYVELLFEAALTAIQYPDEVNNLIHQYKENLVALPQWLNDYFSAEEGMENDYESQLKLNQLIIEHIDDNDIADILKTLSSHSFSE